MRYVQLAAVMVGMVFSALASAAVESRAMPIVLGKTPAGEDIVSESVLYWDPAVRSPRAAVLVFPEWWGLTEYPKARARQLAALGYVALAVDLYGGGKTVNTFEEAQALATPFYENRTLFRARAKAAFDRVIKLREVDPGKVAAIGFCFGGTTSLELARSGIPLAAAVSFHGDLSVADPKAKSDAPNIKASLLVLHGSADPMVPPRVVQAFVDEMNAAKVDFQVISYANAVHAFSNPSAGQGIPGAAEKGIAYDEKAATRSWAAMLAFFGEKLSAPAGGAPLVR